jgi:hypothetical protein
MNPTKPRWAVVLDAATFLLAIVLAWVGLISGDVPDLLFALVLLKALDLNYQRGW